MASKLNLSKLILGASLFVYSVITKATYSSSPNFHSVNTLLAFAHLPDLFILRTCQHNKYTSVWSIPAMLSILVSHGEPLSLSKTLPIRPNIIIHKFGAEADKVAHIRICTAFLRFLFCRAHE